jgi:glycosyltransferase involved in cell wall biosynthesis
MRVALNVEQLAQRPPGGIGRYTAELARLLPVPSAAAAASAGEGGAGVDLVTFMARHGRATTRAALEQFGLGGSHGLRPIRLWLPRPVLYDAWNVLGVPPLGLVHRDLRRLDVVHAPSLAVPPRDGARLVVTVHDAAPILFPETYPPRGRRFHEQGFAATARRADVVIALTQAAADEISAGTPVPADRIRIVPHGVEQEMVADEVVVAARSALGIGSAPYVLWVGTLEPRKGLPTLVEAFASVVAARDLRQRLVIVGSRGWLDTADAISEPARALGDRISFTGPVSEPDLLALYRGADLFAFPSRHEGFGLPVLEAMAQGTAVLCSDIPVLHEVGDDSVAYVGAGDVGAWSDALVALLRDDAGRAALARAGRARAEGFTWERCIARTRAVYRSVV